MPFGVYSGIAKPDQVMVHSPGLEQARLPPSNAEELTREDQPPASGLRKRSFVTETDFQPRFLLELARTLKQARYAGAEMKSTRSTFGSAAFEHGAHVMDVVEPTEETAGDTAAGVTITDDPAPAAGVDFMHTSAWLSTSEAKDAWAILEHAAMSESLEVTDDVSSSAASIMFDQAENRLQAIRRFSLRHSDN